MRLPFPLVCTLLFYAYAYAASKKWSAVTYYANFTSGKSNMSGTAVCRVASTSEELDI